MPNKLITQKKIFKKPLAWLIIFRDKQEKRFESLKAVRTWAEEHHIFLKKSRTQEKCFETDANKPKETK